MRPQGFFGSWGESLFIYQGAGTKSSYFKGAREQALNFSELGSTAKTHMLRFWGRGLKVGGGATHLWVLIFTQAIKGPAKNILGSMPRYILGAGEQLYYFQGFREHEQNNFREQRKIFSGSWGDSGIIFREQGSTDSLPLGILYSISLK